MAADPKWNNSDPNAHSNDFYRATADRLVKESTVNGTLDFDRLRAATLREARKEVFDSHGIDAAKGNVKPLVDEQISNLTLATREVLGIVPQNKWRHDARDTLSNAVESALHIGGETQPTHGLACTQAGHEIGAVSPNLPLAKQNVVCKRR